MNTIKARLSNSRYLYIKARDENTSLDAKMYAINWFNTRIGWMYMLYGLLAGRCLLKAGGRPRFKGKITKVILGNEENKRDTLLIVRYPSGMAFKALVEKTIFKLVSIFRIKSVGKFTFGFSTKDVLTPEKPTRDISRSYAVHHFRGKPFIIDKIRDPKLRDPVQIIYAGMISSHLFAGDHEKPKVQVPCVMDGIIVYSAENPLTLSAFFDSVEYQAIVGATESSFIGFLNREF